MIEIKGLDKAMILALLFNASAPRGMGFIAAGFSGPLDMTYAEAQDAIKRHGALSFDYLYGRVLKANLQGDEFDPWLFDRDNGGDGTAEKLIEHLKQSGNIRRPDASSFADSKMSEDEILMYSLGALHPNAKKLL